MKISNIKSTEKPLFQIYLYNDVNQLKFLDLSDNETDYLKKENGDITFLQRLPTEIYLTKVSAETTKEQTRRLGNKVAAKIAVADVFIKDCSEFDLTKYFAEGIALSKYQFDKYFTEKNKKQSLENIYLAEAEKSVIEELNATISGVFKARDLVNEPLNHLSAEQLAKATAKAGKKYGFEVEVFNKSKIKSLKMGGLLAVNRGSQDPPTFTIAKYKPENAKNEKPIILVGKGVVYDTGGMSLKPTANSMDLMKSDMSGAAAVIGTLISIAQAKLPIYVIGLIPATDNRPGENAYVPGDIITMYDKSTVEVLNTDAEGRMILADALAYAKQYNPELVIDLATLTGAAAVAIGKQGLVAMGTAGNDCFNKLKSSGNEEHERIVEFPFWDDYNELLKSSVADVKNIGGREAGAITAGKFLERFTDYPWIHLDIAGPAFLTANDHYRLRGGTGVGVRLLFNFLKNWA